MRGTVAGLASPWPLADTLPAMLREDAFARALCSGFDEVLAPVLLSLDTFPAYLDLATAPDDMVPWLAQWVAMTIDPDQDLGRQRQLLRSSVELHGSRGTRRGIELAVQAEFGTRVQVTETGAAAWSATSGGELPGEPHPSVDVVVWSDGDHPVDPDRLDAVVRSVKPAHVRHRVEVVGQDGSVG